MHAAQHASHFETAYEHSTQTPPPAAQRQLSPWSPSSTRCASASPRRARTQAQAFARGVLQAHERRRIAQHGAEGWAALAGDMLDFARVRKPGTANVRVFNADQGARLGVAAYGAADRQRRHAVPGRLGDHGAGRAGHRRARAGHPVVPLERDKAGKLAGGRRRHAPNRSCTWKSTASRPKRWPTIEKRGRRGARRRARDRRATGARCATRCWRSPTNWPRASMPVTEAGRAEAQEFLRWAADDHFTFLGYREYEVVKARAARKCCGQRGHRPRPVARQGRRQAARR